MTDSTLTLDTLIQAQHRLDAMLPRGPSLRTLMVSDFLTETRPRKLSRWERLRVRLENAADLADLIYPWRRVQRSQTVPSREVYRIGDRLLCHPAMAEQIKRHARRAAGLETP